MFFISIPILKTLPVIIMIKFQLKSTLALNNFKIDLFNQQILQIIDY